MAKFLLILSNLAFPFAAIGVFLGFLFSARRKLLTHLIQELKERFARETPQDLPQNALWIHCASVGEVLSVKELINRLKAFYNKPILVTTSTAAGQETAKKNPAIDKAVLAPLDFYPLVRSFIRKANPYRLFIVEREIWPNMLAAARYAHIPYALVNARISRKSTRAYGYVKPLFEFLLKGAAFAALQSHDDKRRYERIGLPAEKAFVCGNVKYDTLSDTPAKIKEVQALIKQLGWEGKTVFVCGSTHPLEEDILLKSAPQLIKQGVKIIFAPRHLERRTEIEHNLRQSGLSFAMMSQNPAACDILCADQMGFLQSLYTCASITFVGGSIAPRGAHNLLEPAIVGKVVLFGKSFHNTPDTAHALLTRGGGILVDENNFEQTVLRLLRDKTQLLDMSEKARRTALSFKGATDKIMKVVENYERKSA